MRRSYTYIIFSLIVILGFIILVRSLDEEAVDDLEINFNQQQAVQVELASRTIEEQFDWQHRNVIQVATDISQAVEYLYFYDVTKKRLLYSARSINQVSSEALEARLQNIISTSFYNDILMWGFIEQEQEVFIPTNRIDDSNAIYQRQLKAWVKQYHDQIIDETFVTPVYATEDLQIIGILYPLYAPNGNRLGTLAGLINLSPTLEQFIKPIRSGQFGAAWIQDFSGQVIFDHETEIIGDSVYDLHASYPELLELDYHYTQELSGVSEYNFTVQRGGDVKRKLVAWNTATLGNQNLTVALSSPDTEISALLSSSRQTSLLSGVILTILLVGAGMLFYRLQQTELRHLVKERTIELEHEQQRLTAEIAERERVEVALRESEMNFRQLAENIREVFFLFDTQKNQIVYVSPSYEDIWQSENQLVGKTSFAIIPTIFPDDRHLVREQIKLFLSTPEARSIEFRIVRGDNAISWIRWRAFPVTDDDLITRLICTAEDITSQKLARDAEISIEIERKRAQLLATFVQDAFHEFRTPLSIINTSVYLLDNIKDEEKRKEYLSFIRSESGNIMHLVEQLVTMARLDVEEPFHEDYIHVDTMLSDLKIMTESDIDKASLQAAWDLDAKSIYVQGDQEQIHRAIKNIIDNAIKYSDAGGQIFIRTRRDDQFAVIEITDTGEGIDEGQIEHIFKRFYRVDKAHTTRGFGLGLPISQRIIKRHGGAITTDSVYGQGTSFRILLPIVEHEELELT